MTRIWDTQPMGREKSPEGERKGSRPGAEKSPQGHPQEEGPLCVVSSTEVERVVPGGRERTRGVFFKAFPSIYLE